jgi:hypothetical protein
VDPQAAAVEEHPQPLPFDDIRDGEFVLATIHRADNTDDPNRLRFGDERPDLLVRDLHLTNQRFGCRRSVHPMPP